MTREVSNEDVLRALVEIGGGLHREFGEFKQTLLSAAKSINEQKFEEAKHLTRELEELSHHILNTKREIALMRSAESSPGGFEAANFELDAIVKATEDATNGIMNAAEAIEQHATALGGELDADARAAEVTGINNQVVAIFEHCNFQDLTGQRISKIIRTLDYISTRIENMIRIWGPSVIDGAMEGEPAPEKEKSDEALLNGPQLPGQGVSQNEIDNLFR